MKNKTVILILSVLAVAMYTTAVINFCLGNVLGGIGDVLMASSDALIWLRLVKHIDGLNVSPKNEYEWDVLRKLHLHWHWPEYMGDERLSNRLYVFDDQWSQYELFKQNFTLTDNWQIIGRKWDSEFKTPENEHFVRLPILW